MAIGSRSPLLCFFLDFLHGSVEPASAEEVLFQDNITYPCGYTVGGLATVTREFARTCLFDGSFSLTDVVCLTDLATYHFLLIPRLVPMLLCKWAECYVHL